MDFHIYHLNPEDSHEHRGVCFLLDPAGIAGSLYAGYLRAPAGFKILPGKGGKWKEFQLKEPLDGFEAVYVSEKPFWLYGFRGKSAAGVSVERLNSAPEQIEKIPDDVKARLKGIHFEDSPLSLARHMRWL